jgi:hypothetical protein
MDDAELWQRFSTQDLTHAEWNHRLHVRTAFLHLSRYELDEAHLRMRAGIIRLNQRHGLEETPSRGYFETMTRVWLCLVQAARRQCAAVDSVALLEHCPALLDRELPLRHYTKERLMSVQARAIFVEPDRAALPATGAILESSPSRT